MTVKSSAAEIKKAAETFLKEKNIAHTSVGEPMPPPPGTEVVVWSVPYDYQVFQEETAFVEIDDETRGIRRVRTKHGYDYVNGQKAPEPADDGEDWSDL